MGEQKNKEAEEAMLPFVGGLEIVDDEDMAAVSSKFALPNEEICRAIVSLEEIDDDVAGAIDEARKEFDALCGLGGFSEKEIIEPPSEEDESLLSAIDKAAGLQSCFHEAEEELAQIDDLITTEFEDLENFFDFRLNYKQEDFIMGSKKLEVRQKVEADAERGQEIAEIGEQKIEEAETSEQALSSIEAVDDDTAADVEKARSESDAIAKGVAESEIKEPGEQVSESFQETSEESTEYSEQELENADTATEMTGDYGDVGSELSGQFQESGQEFQEIADEADQENDEMNSKLEQEVDELEGVF